MPSAPFKFIVTCGGFICSRPVRCLLRNRHSLLALVTLAACLLSPLHADISIPGITLSSSKKNTASPANPSSPEATLQEWLKEAKATFARLDQPDAETQLPQGISPEALVERRRDVDQTIRNLNRSLSLLAALPEVQAAAETARQKERDWSHFSDKPPYSLLLVDELNNQRDAAREKVVTSRSSISLFQRSLDSIRAEAVEAEKRSQALAKSLFESPDNTALKWQVNAAADKSRLIAARSSSATTNIDLLNSQVEAAQADVDLTARQIAEASKSAVLTDAGIGKIQAASNDRIVALQKETAATRQRLREATGTRTQAKNAFDRAAADTPPGEEADPVLSARLATADTRVEVLQFIAENLDTFQTLETLTPSIYEKRKEYLTAKTRTARQDALGELHAALDRLTAWQTVSSNEMASVTAELGKQDSLAALITAADPRASIFAERRELLWEKQRFLQRAVQTASHHRKNLARWVDAYDEAERPRTWTTWFSDTAGKAKNILQRIWTFNLFEITKTEELPGGQTKTSKQGIALNLVLSALLFFLIAYLVLARLTRRMQNLAIRSGRIAEAQANTMRNWLMIVVGIALALTTLHILKIPLTVFAFFGGALAIGLGFGTQTLIKNFISGIIVLFERRIRVGDIIDVGAVSGKVVEINTRSSVIRSGDGKETLIPNSVFLENQVTNQTLTNRRVRRLIHIGVAYGSSPSQVSSILKECAERHGLILKDPAPNVLFEDFGDNALIFSIYFWTEFDDRTDAGVVASDVRMMIEKRFSETGIEFPYPQRDIHLHTASPLKIDLLHPENPSSPTP